MKLLDANGLVAFSDRQHKPWLIGIPVLQVNDFSLKQSRRAGRRDNNKRIGSFTNHMISFQARDAPPALAG